MRGADEPTTGVSLTAVTERIHSDGAILPGRKHLLLMKKTTLDGSSCWMDNTFKWASTERQRFVVLYVHKFTSDLVVVIHNCLIGSFSKWNRQQHSHRSILGMSVNAALTIFIFASWVIYVPIGCRHPFIRYWQPLQTKTTATCSLLHPENQRQWSVNSFRSCRFRNHGIAWICTRITVLLTALKDKNIIYQRWNTDTKLIDIANCTTCKSALLVAENTILIRYYKQTTNTRALYESIAGPAGQPAYNPPNSDGLGVYHLTIPEWMVQVYWQPWLLIWQPFGLNQDSDPKWWSETVDNTSQHISQMCRWTGSQSWCGADRRNVWVWVKQRM